MPDAVLVQNDEFLRLVINGVHMDLNSRNEAFECLALSFIGSGEGRGKGRKEAASAGQGGEVGKTQLSVAAAIQAAAKTRAGWWGKGEGFFRWHGCIKAFMWL